MTDQPVHQHIASDKRDVGPVVQSIISLKSLLMVKMLIVLVRTLSNSQLFLLKKYE